MGFQHWIVHLAAAEKLGERMTNELGDPQLPLRRLGSGACMMT